MLARVGFLAQDSPAYSRMTVAHHLDMGRWLNPTWDRAFADRRAHELGLDRKLRGVASLQSGLRPNMVPDAATALNDDRIGRALDEIHPHVVDAWTTLVLHGTQAHGVRLGQLHSDVTRIAFEGSYEPASPSGQDPPGPRITYGCTGKEDPTRKQLTVSVSVTAGGALPAWYQVADGNAADRPEGTRPTRPTSPPCGSTCSWISP